MSMAKKFLSHVLNSWPIASQEIIHRIVAMSLLKEQILLIALDRQISSLTEIVTLQLKLHKFNFTTYGLSRRRILDVSNGIDEPGEIRLPLATANLLLKFLFSICCFKNN